MLLFYGKAIVKNENCVSQFKHFFSKVSIVSRFSKTEGVARDRDITGEKLSGF
jgi:hypothetical protein